MALSKDRIMNPIHQQLSFSRTTSGELVEAVFGEDVLIDLTAHFHKSTKEV